jgi:lipoprotein-releasing system permease protein
LAIIGVEPHIGEQVSAIERNLRRGRLADLRTVVDGVIVSEDLADRLGLGIGDVVAATSPSGATRSLRLVGLAKPWTCGEPRSEPPGGTRLAGILLAPGPRCGA